MFKSLKKVVSESESAALSINNINDEDDSDDSHALSSDPQNKSKHNKSGNIIRSISSNIKEKLQKKKFHRLELDDKASDSIEDDIEIENEDSDENNLINNDNNNNNNGDKSYSQLEIPESQIQSTQLQNKKYSNDSLHSIEEDDSIELSQLSNEDDGNDSGVSPHKQIASNQFEDTYTFCLTFESIFCHLFTMIFVSFTQFMVSCALYIIVPLHISIRLEGDILLTGLIFLNYGFAYVVFNIFGNMCCRYYGSMFTILLAILMNSLSLLFMAIFTDYFVWLIMMFCQGISFALFNVGYNNFIIDNISIKFHNKFTYFIQFFNYISMICGCIYAGNIIQYNSITFAIGITFILSLSGILFLCVFNIPPKYNNNSLIEDDEMITNENRIITKASIIAWKSSYKQLSFKQRFSIFAWIKMDTNMSNENINTPIYEMDEKLNTLQIFYKNVWTILSILIFSFTLTFIRCIRLLIITFKCIEMMDLEMDMTPKDIGIINGISFIPEIILYIFSTKILYKFGRKYTLIPSFLLFIISLLLLPYCENKQSLIYISLLFGISNGFSYNLIYKVVIDIAPTEYRNKFLIIYKTLTNIAYIIAPIFLTLLIQILSIKITCICCVIIIILSFIWSICVMTDPKKTGKRYQQIDFEKSYQINDNEISINGLVNGKHIGPPIPINNKNHRIKMELHSIDSVMELDQSVAGNDTNVETKNHKNIFNENNNNNNNSSSENEDDTINVNDTYVNRIANKPIENNIKLGQEQNNNIQYKFEIGHFDEEEEEEESMMYQLSSTDED